MGRIRVRASRVETGRARGGVDEVAGGREMTNCPEVVCVCVYDSARCGCGK